MKILDNIKQKIKEKREQQKLEITVIDDNMELPDFRKISVPDLKKYMADGYNEIRLEKAKNMELQKDLEEAKEYKKFYEGALVTVDEFKKRDDENKETINFLNNKIEAKDNKIIDLEEIINTYKIREFEVLKKENNTALVIKEQSERLIQEYKQKLIQEIENHKGNISKTRLYYLINKL